MSDDKKGVALLDNDAIRRAAMIVRASGYVDLADELCVILSRASSSRAEVETLTVVRDALEMSAKIFAEELTDWRYKQVCKALRKVKSMLAAAEEPKGDQS